MIYIKIISIIQTLLKQENMSYTKIKEYIENVMTLRFEN